MMKYSTYNSIFDTAGDHKNNELFDNTLQKFWHKNRRAMVRMLIILSVVIFSLTGFMNVVTNASKVVSYEKFVVSSGDSLWSIAVDHKPDGMDTREYIGQIKKLNSLQTSNIQAGQVLSLPYME